MTKINDWIDNSPAVQNYMFVASIVLAILIFQTRQNYLAIAFCVGASLIFFPPIQKSIRVMLEQDIATKYFMRMGSILVIIAIFAQVRH